MALLVAFGAGPARAGLADQVGATFGLMVREVVGAFPAVEGIVVATQAERVFLDLGEDEGVQPGQEYTLFRKGDVFRHPLTGRPLGRFETLLGYAQVQRVHPEFSEALYIPVPEAPEVAPEDGVRITRGRIRVAVTPVIDLTVAQADLRRVPFMVALGLEQTRRFQATDPSAVQDLLLSRRVRVEEFLVRPERAVALGKELGVAGWLVPMVLERGGVSYLDVTWISAVTGTPLFSRRLPLVRAEAVAEQRFPWEPVPED